jgi:hypothetical protein
MVKRKQEEVAALTLSGVGVTHSEQHGPYQITRAIPMCASSVWIAACGVELRHSAGRELTARLGVRLPLWVSSTPKHTTMPTSRYRRKLRQ